jgi:hypothetical protein
MLFSVTFASLFNQFQFIEFSTPVGVEVSEELNLVFMNSDQGYG